MVTCSRTCFKCLSFLLHQPHLGWFPNAIKKTGPARVLSSTALSRQRLICKYLSNITKFCFKAPISQISQLQHDVRQCCIDRPTIEFRLFGAKINNLLNPASVATAVLLVMGLILCLLHILCVFHWPVLKAFVCNVFILGSFGLALLPAETARSPDHFKSKL